MSERKPHINLAEMTPKIESPAETRLHIGERLVRNLAYKLKGTLKDTTSLTLQDIKASGSMGLAQALQNFDEDKAALTGASFFTYAYRRIWGSMIDEIRRVDGRLSKRVKAANATHEELVGVTSKTPFPDSFAVVENNELLTQLEAAIPHLKPQYQQLFKLLFEYKNAAEICEALGIDKSSLSRWFRKAMASLQEQLGVTNVEPLSWNEFQDLLSGGRTRSKNKRD